VAGWIDPAYVTVPQDKILSATIENAQGNLSSRKTRRINGGERVNGRSEIQSDSVVTLMARLGSIAM